MAEAKIALEIDQTVWMPRYAIALSYVSRGQLGEAREWAEQAVHAAPWNPHCAALLAGVLTRLGEPQRASQLVVTCQSNPAHLFLYRLLCSEIDAAADCYEAAIAQGEPSLLFLAASGFLKPLRESPRWPAIACKMKLSSSATDRNA